MPRPVAAAALAIAIAVSGCGGAEDGGGGGGGFPAAQLTYSVSGEITAASGQRVDSDTNDPAQQPKIPNDTVSTAQRLPRVVTVGGSVAGAVDEVDHYRATLEAGQVVTLVPVRPLAAELCVMAASVVEPPPDGCHAAPTGQVSLPVVESGETILRVRASGGGSTAYTLVLGPAPAGVEPAALGETLAEFVPDEVVVRFRDAPFAPPGRARGLEERARALGLALRAGGPGRGRAALLGLEPGSARERALGQHGITPAARERPLLGILDPVAAAKLDTLRLVEALRAHGEVESADPNFVYRPSLVPNDPHYPHQWHYPLIRLPEAWDVAEAGALADVVVAVLDTGVLLAHGDFTGQLVPGYDFIRDPGRANDGGGIDPDPDDPGDGASQEPHSWHGTHVAGTVAARTNDGVGSAGVAFRAKVMPVRVLGVGGGTSYDIMQGLRWAAGLPNDSNTLPREPASILNLSFGCAAPGCASTAERALYAELRARGVLVVAAAGNEGSSSPSYPAAYPGVVSVSAVDPLDARAPYSNTGPTVAIAAPGGNMGAGLDLNGDGRRDGILSASVKMTGTTRAQSWAYYQGTSMAAPHVAGVAALMKGICPTLGDPAGAVETRFADGFDALLAAGALTRDLGAPGRDDVFGHGRVDALKAVRAAKAACGHSISRLEISPGRIDFREPATAFRELTASRIGDGPLEVTSAVPTARWLSVTGGGDAASGWTYAVTVDRTGLADGLYTAVIAFRFETDLGAGVTSLPVTLQVGSGAATGDVGALYVMLVDSSETVRASTVVAGSGTRYPFRITGVPAGRYRLIATTDLDGRGGICGAAEACGGWPSAAEPQPFSISADVLGRDFSVEYPAIAPVAAQPPSALPDRGPGAAVR